jgi:sialic acid synthase SpsE
VGSLTLRNSVVLGDFERPYIVAEINTSHFGNIETAKQMIIKAKDSGCDCVKFQSWSAETLYSKTYYDKNPIAKRFVEGFSFSKKELAVVAEYSDKLDIDFASTPYSTSEVDFLINECNVPYIKIASMDLNNHNFLNYIARTGSPIVLSTGMGDMNDIKKAVEIIENAGNNNICILHCISIYPPEIHTIRLNNILGLRQAFPDYPIGFSDHSIGIEIPSAAVALGSCMIEKHFTLDRMKIGMDNQVATEPEEMARLVQNCHNVQTALGGLERVVLPAEIEQRLQMRRSIVTTKKLKAGRRLTVDDLDVKRPGTGIPPDRFNELVGRVLVKDIDSDTLILESDVESVENNEL